MTEQPHDAPDEVVRTQAFDTDTPLELDVDITIGRVEITLDGDTTETTVEVRHDPAGAPQWTEGVTSLLSWVGERFGSQLGTTFGMDLTPPPSDAVTQTRVDLTGGRLVVRGPRPAPLRQFPLSVTVRAPEGSSVTARTGTGDVTVTGTADRVDLTTGAGGLTVERAETATARTGTGHLRLGPVAGTAHVRAGSGDVEIASLAGSTTIGTGTGDVWLGELTGDVHVRTSTGSVTVADAAAGELDATSGSGELRIGLRRGVAAEIDLSSGSGRVDSELDVAETPPEGEVTLAVRARSGSGDVTVTRTRD